VSSDRRDVLIFTACPPFLDVGMECAVDLALPDVYLFPLFSPLLPFFVVAGDPRQTYLKIYAHFGAWFDR